MNKDEEQKNKIWWPKEEILKESISPQTADEIKNSWSGTEQTEYRKGRLRLNPKKKQFPDFELNCLSSDEHDVLWNITSEKLSETKRNWRKLTSALTSRKI